METWCETGGLKLWQRGRSHCLFQAVLLQFLSLETEPCPTCVETLGLHGRTISSNPSSPKHPSCFPASRHPGQLGSLAALSWEPLSREEGS